MNMATRLISSRTLQGRTLERRILEGRTLEGRVLQGRTLGATETEPRYQLPFPESVPKRISRPTGKYAHENFPESRYAVDFLLDVGTPILAAREGRVVAVKADSEAWGTDLQFRDKVNYLGIDHGDGTYAEYLHFGKDRVVVRIGKRVRAGELLGYSGLSGCMDLPHLHFNVFVIEDGKARSIPIEFA